MPHKFDPKNIDALLSAERQNYLDPSRVMARLPLRPYQVLADIGCGPGYFTIPLAKYLFDGKLFAVDVQQEMLVAVKRELDRVRLTNVELVLSEEKKLPFEDDSLDGAFAAFMMHEADDRSALLEDTRRCLRGGGWLAMLEWHKREMDEGPPLEDRIDETELREAAQEVGFRLTASQSLNDRQYMVLMRA